MQFPLSKRAKKKRRLRAVPSFQRGEEEKTALCNPSPQRGEGEKTAPCSPLTPKEAKVKRRLRTVPSHQRGEEEKTAPCSSLSPNGQERKDTSVQSPLPYGERVRVRGYSGCVCASTTASATMFTIRRTEAIGVNTCTGFATPISTGPTVTPSELETRSRL